MFQSCRHKGARTSSVSKYTLFKEQQVSVKQVRRQDLLLKLFNQTIHIIYRVQVKQTAGVYSECKWHYLCLRAVYSIETVQSNYIHYLQWWEGGPCWPHSQKVLSLIPTWDAMGAEVRAFTSQQDGPGIDSHLGCYGRWGKSFHPHSKKVLG